MADSETTIAESARKISELEQVSCLHPEDMLSFDRPSDGKTYSITLGDLESAVMSEALKRLDLDSAAFTPADMYSPAAHDHPYSDFDFFPSYGPGSGNENVQAAKTGTFVIRRGNGNVSSVDVYVPVQETIFDTTEVDPFVGEIKMLGVQNFKRWLQHNGYSITTYSGGKKNINIAAPSFDGWVIPNGTTFAGILPEEFTQVCRVYGATQNASDTSFTVPDLAGFFKCHNGKTACGIPLSAVPKRNVLLSHTHGVKAGNLVQENPSTAVLTSFTLSGTGGCNDLDSNAIHRQTAATTTYISNTDFSQLTTFYDGTGYRYQCGAFAYDHAGYLDGRAIKITKIQADTNNTSILIKSSGSTGEFEQYPDYQLVPALIYIGRRI